MWRFTTSISPGAATPIYVRPTGLDAVPPPGPAMPVTLMATSAFSSSRAPVAISLATGSLTAPLAMSVPCFTLRMFCFTALE